MVCTTHRWRAGGSCIRTPGSPVGEDLESEILRSRSGIASRPDPMVGHSGTTFAADMGYRSADGGWLPRGQPQMGRLLRGKQDEKSASIEMRKCRRMRDEGRA